ncbi:MAG: hypothetical protein JWN99_1224, partial [Ilumatobacteraceae bacterium]|nr:hypothetical protein [Ilumatobacteraceae bacterium]
QKEADRIEAAKYELGDIDLDTYENNLKQRRDAFGRYTEDYLRFNRQIIALDNARAATAKAAAAAPIQGVGGLEQQAQQNWVLNYTGGDIDNKTRQQMEMLLRLQRQATLAGAGQK